MFTKKIFFSSLVAIVSCFTFGATALGASNGDISINPSVSSRTSDPRSNSWFLYEFTPGEQKSDSFTVTNESAKRRTLKLYAVDGYLTEQGGFALRKATDKIEEVGKWITLDKDEITLAPNASETISFIYYPPEGLASGEYSGGIVAQDTEVDGNSGIQVVKRVGVRLYHTIPGNIVQDTQQTGSHGRKTIGFIPWLLLIIILILLVLSIVRRNQGNKRHKHRK